MRSKSFFYLSSLLSIFLCISCHQKSDEELLRLERTKLKEKLESQSVLFYKLFKIVLRTQTAENAKQIPGSEHLQKINSRIIQAIDTTKSDTTYISLEDMVLAYKEYNDLKDFALTTDEDMYPTLLETFFKMHTGETPALSHTNISYAELFGWDNNMEHTFLSTTNTSARRTELALYEGSRVDTEHEKDMERRCLYKMQKGLLFITEDFPYLSEHELTSNHEWLEKDGQSYQYSFFQNLIPTGTNKDTYHYAHGINLICRGLSRIKMDREDKKKLALQDFEAFLSDANAIGLNDELVWLVATYVALEREDNQTALANLKKLEKSTIFSNEDKAILHSGIEYLEAKEDNKASNLITDKVFMGKIAIQYFITQMKKVDWKKYTGARPEVATLMRYNEQIQQQLEKVKTTATLDNLKKEGGGLLDKAKKVIQ
ncbi:hypothetical protein [Xanthocytophaga flava]|uniref:hypothetical protein n=1 Tax=Xanthocytophaga flava TaxID=3048013 RepID=UPI0028D27641|nr:hypothetical protein [Xanthocytophaga flavus]MDJ1466276.1 hypothetical protein [Xanthocytophaga flavus]